MSVCLCVMGLLHLYIFFSHVLILFFFHHQKEALELHRNTVAWGTEGGCWGDKIEEVKMETVFFVFVLFF